jgi:serine/threonine protein kinase
MKDYNFINFGKYVLAESIAKGGMGQVFLSIYGDAGWEKFCAIKRVLPKNSNPEALLRFRTEVEITLGLNHSNLVSLFDVGIISQQAYMAMELVEGENLRTIWNRCAEKRVPFPLEVIIYMIKESAKALNYAHKFRDLGMVHRDISPPNLMMSFSGEMKVLDFGLALSTSTKRFTKPGIVYGKLPYLSPEQARGEILTSHSDIYSLGIVFWELITGRRLFELEEDENLIDKLKLRSKGPSVKPPSIVSGRSDDELDSIVLAMLDPIAQNRPSGDEVVSLLGKYLSSKYPGTDTNDAANFITSLFSEKIKENEKERQHLLKEYQEWRSSSRKKEIRAGDMIAGRYLITRVIGEGGMGKVYEAIQESIGKRVAIKVLEPKTTMAVSESEVRFKREAKAASRIKHPSVVNILDYGFLSEMQPFLVMELLEGHSMGDVVASGPLETDRACRLGSQLARGIHAAHEAGLIHRDIKPDNIQLIIDHNGQEQIKLIDFGIAKSSLGEEEDLTRPGITLGTPEYIAPELLLGEKPKIAADIYSFGAVLYEFVTGSPPYSGNRTETIIQNKIKGNRKSIHEVNPKLPLKVRTIIESCMDHDPRRRPSSLKSIAEELELLFEKMTNPVQHIMDIVPSRAVTGMNMGKRAGDKRDMGNHENGNWIPLGLALSGVVVFILGLMQVGKSNTSFNSFKNVENFNTPLNFQEEKLPGESTKLALLTPKPRIEIPRLEKKIKKTRKRRRKPRVAKGKTYFSAAKVAFNQGKYPKAYELARRSIMFGGGKKARQIRIKAGRILGLND